jgi:hypothetical protein
LPFWSAHVLWANGAQGHFFVREQYDPELWRHVRVATLEAGEGHKVILGSLLDAALVSCKPDWWTLTGWERVDSAATAAPRAFAAGGSSWVSAFSARNDGGQSFDWHTDRTPWQRRAEPVAAHTLPTANSSICRSGCRS